MSQLIFCVVPIDEIFVSVEFVDSSRLKLPVVDSVVESIEDLATITVVSGASFVINVVFNDSSESFLSESKSSSPIRFFTKEMKHF